MPEPENPNNPGDPSSKFWELLNVLGQKITEPLGALITIEAILYFALAVRYDFSEPGAHPVLYGFLGLTSISLGAVLIYQRQALRKGDQGDIIELPKGIAERDARIGQLENDVKQLNDRLLMSAKVRNWQSYEDRIDIRSIDTDLDTPESYKDRAHHYSELTFSASVDFAGNYKGRYTRKGVRKTEGMTDFMYFRVGASSQLESAESIGLIVTDLESKKPLRVSIEDNADLISKTFKIHLAKSLKQGDRFGIQIEFTWPECIINSRDTDTIDLSVFPLGVDVLRHELDLEFDPSAVRLFETHGHEIVRSTQQVTERQSKGRHILSYTVANPVATGYVIAFSRSISRAA